MVRYLLLAAELPQALTAFTVTFPLMAPTFTQMILPVAEPTKLAPAGIVHIYDVAPLTALTENPLVILGQLELGPEIVPGVASVLLLIMMEAGELFPQLLAALTLNTEPETKLLPKLSCMLLLFCPVTIVVPAGTVQEYVSPLTNGVV